MKEEALDAIVLHSKAMFERDKIIEVLSKDQGKLRILAKGAATGKSKLGARIEPMNYLTIQVFRGRSFMQTRQCDLLRAYPEIRNDYNRLATMFYFIEVIQGATAFFQPAPTLFTLLRLTLEKMNNKESLSKVKTFFHQAFLESEGLIDEKEKEITDFNFKQQFEDYTGRRIQIPTFQ